MECYYHNVAKFEQEGDGFAWFFNHGYKRLWFEYTGVIEIGIDMDKATISEPDENGVYTSSLPEVEILTDPQIIESSISDPLTEQGFATSITDEDYLQTLQEAQATMREAAENNGSLRLQARESKRDSQTICCKLRRSYRSGLHRTIR